MRESVFLLQDNVPIHTAQVTVTEVVSYSIELLPYPT